MRWTDAIAAGDWALAGEVALKALEVAMRKGFEDIVTKIVSPFVETVAGLLKNLPGTGGFFAQIEMAAQIGGAGLFDFGGDEAGRELDELKKKAKEARREVEGRKPRSLPLDVDSPDIVAPALVAPSLEVAAVPEMESVQQEISARMSAMGGFNAASLGGMFGDSGSKIEEHTKRSAEFLGKLLEQGKKARDGLVWS